MNNKFISLNCDDDVVLLERDTFKVSRLKDLVKEEIRQKWHQSIYNHKTKNCDGTVANLFNTISIGEERINISEIQYNSIKDCQILKIGGGWQKGKLKIQMCISPDIKQPDKVCLEFCPDEPPEPESPLDDIRQMILAQK